MIVIILGPDSGLAHSILKRILADRDPSGDSTSFLDGNSVSIRTVITDISSIGFFAAGRVVVVENLLARLGKQGAKDGGSAPDWAGLFAAVPEASTLVLLDPTITTIGALANKALPKHAIIEHAKPPRGPQLIDWIIATAKRAGGEIDKATAQQLAMQIFPQGWATEPRNPLYDRPPDMAMLENEINKLVTAAWPDRVTQTLVNEMSPKEQDDRIFAFLDAAAAGNVPDAIRELDKLIANGEDPAKLLAQLSGNLELGTPVSAAGRCAPDAIASDIGGVTAQRIRPLQSGLQGMSPGVAQRRSGIAADADRKFKSGQLKEPLDTLYDTILAIADMRQSVRQTR
ncbi:MAG: hypothetical protein M9953_13440 [Thermomicrobiales bacterium]|nr:hypothetical protein [Thermomicrobiales bacterium]MCO5217308.1 hypothetical protein [Thermomicrobiales bacterium]MCO5226336.1 hypothetical protein [Thermomicrobiales bacterium]